MPDGGSGGITASAEPLVVGMRVAVAAHRAEDLELRTHILVDDVRVLAYPQGFVRTGPTMAGASLYWESGCVFVTVDAEGEGRLAQLLDIIYLGDWTSYYLALDNDVDPGPIDAITQLKERIATSSPSKLRQ